MPLTLYPCRFTCGREVEQLDACVHSFLPSFRYPTHPPLAAYADVDHLTYYDKILWELQYEEDSDEEDVDEEDVDDAESADPSASDGRRRHPDGRINYAEWDVEEENVSKVTPSRKAKKFAEERKVLIEAIRAVRLRSHPFFHSFRSPLLGRAQEGAKLECVENEVHRKLAERKREQKLNDWRDNRPNYSRIEE